MKKEEYARIVDLYAKIDRLTNNINVAQKMKDAARETSSTKITVDSYAYTNTINVPHGMTPRFFDILIKEWSAELDEYEKEFSNI